MQNYILRTTGEPQLKYPCAHLLKATSSILSAAISGRENVATNQLITSSQLQTNGLEISASAEKTLNEFIKKCCDTDLEDLELDSSNESLTKGGSDGKLYRVFGYMILQLIDVIIEHLWNSSTPSFENNANVRQKIEKLISRRKNLLSVLETKTKNAPNIETQVSDLQIDIPKLAMMLETVNS